MPKNGGATGGTLGAHAELSCPIPFDHPTRVLIDSVDFLVPDIWRRLRSECGLSAKEVNDHLYLLARAVRTWSQDDFYEEDRRTRLRLHRLEKIAGLVEQLQPLLDEEYGGYGRWCFGKSTGIFITPSDPDFHHIQDSVGDQIESSEIRNLLSILVRDARLRSAYGNQVFADLKARGNNYRRRRDQLWSDLLFIWRFVLHRNIGTGANSLTGRSNSPAGRFLEILSEKVLAVGEVGNVRKYLSSNARHFDDLPSAIRKLRIL